jgi:hypothetical protein
MSDRRSFHRAELAKPDWQNFTQDRTRIANAEEQFLLGSGVVPSTRLKDVLVPPASSGQSEELPGCITWNQIVPVFLST